MKTLNVVITILLALAFAMIACNLQDATNTPTIGVSETSTEEMTTGTPNPNETETPVIKESEIPTTEESETPTMEQTETPMPTEAPVSSVTINVSQDATLGSFLVDDQGLTLYLYANDTTNVSTCTGGCATEWPPLLVTNAVSAVAGAGVDITKLSLLARADGTFQVTYNGWPLYYFYEDTQSGDINGQGMGDFYVVSPAGDKIEK